MIQIINILTPPRRLRPDLDLRSYDYQLFIQILNTRSLKRCKITWLQLFCNSKEIEWHESRDVEKRFFFIWKQFFLSKKAFLLCIVTGDVKWIHYKFSTGRKVLYLLDQSLPSTSSLSPKRNIYCSKAIILCIRWDQKGTVFYELPKRRETITEYLYLKYVVKIEHVIETETIEISWKVKNCLVTLRWVLPHLPYSPDITPFDYYLFRAMTHSLSEQHFHPYEDNQYSTRSGWNGRNVRSHQLHHYLHNFILSRLRNLTLSTSYDFQSKNTRK